METETVHQDGHSHHGGGPKYDINIEGRIFPWNEDTITVPQIRKLGGFPAGTPVEMIDLETNDQRTLGESEVVTLRPGLGFAKKIKFKRG